MHTLNFAGLVAALGLVCPLYSPTQGFSCPASFETPNLRPEGAAELIGEMVFTCTGGGAPTPAGQAVPTGTVTVKLNLPVASRMVDAQKSEALLLIDEPNTPANPAAPVLCGSAAAPLNTDGNCPIVGNGTGKPAASGVPNSFLATQTGPYQLTFSGIPFDPPGSTGKRVYRITNVADYRHCVCGSGSGFRRGCFPSEF